MDSFFFFFITTIPNSARKTKIFHEGCTGIFQWQPSEVLQLEHYLNEPQPKLFCHQCKLLIYFSRWKVWYNEIAMSGGRAHNNSRNQITSFFFHSAQAPQLRDGGRQRASPPLNQPKHLQSDSRTEINYLPHDRWQSTDSSNPSLNCFAVMSAGWTMTIWARRILNRTFDKDWGLYL